MQLSGASQAGSCFPTLPSASKAAIKRSHAMVACSATSSKRSIDRPKFLVASKNFMKDANMDIAFNRVLSWSGDTGDSCATCENSTVYSSAICPSAGAFLRLDAKSA
jgi:hypothetical protein